MKVYIAGPMRGKRLFNFNTFEAASVALRCMGLDPISPHQIDLDEGLVEATWLTFHDRRAFKTVELSADFSFERAIRRDLQALLECDAIALLNGWEDSQGACIEAQVAEWVGMPQYALHDSGGLWYLTHWAGPDPIGTDLHAVA